MAALSLCASVPPARSRGAPPPPCTGGVAVPFACRKLGRARQSAGDSELHSPGHSQSRCSMGVPPLRMEPPLGCPCWHPKARAQPPSQPRGDTHTDSETSSRARQRVQSGVGVSSVDPPSGRWRPGPGVAGCQPECLPAVHPLQAACPSTGQGRGTSPGAADACTHTHTPTNTHIHARTEGPARAQSPTEAQPGPARCSPPSQAHPRLPPASRGQGTAGWRNAVSNFCRIATSTRKEGEIN